MRTPEVSQTLVEAVAALQRGGRPFALVGGIAVSARSVVRYTRDIDVTVGVSDDADAERTVQELFVDGWRVLAQVEQLRTQRLATVRLAKPQRAVLDLLFASCGIEPLISAGAEPFAVPDIGVVPVARTEHLIAMKVLSESETRLQDLLDLQALLRTPYDADIVEYALDGITAAGCHRDKDLRHRWVEIRSKYSR